MDSLNPVNVPVTIPSAPNGIPSSTPLTRVGTNPDKAPKRKRTSLLSGLASKFSRNKSSPTTQISTEEIWRTMPNTIHPNAEKLGMNTFDFATGGPSRGKVVERELSPGAVPHRRRGIRENSTGNVSDDGSVSPERNFKDRSSDKDSENDEDERGRIQSGLSAYSDAARKRASGYVPKRSSSSSSSSSLKREPSYGSAQIATFTAAYPRQIDSANHHASESSVQSAGSSMGSSMQRNGSSLFDRSMSRWDSMDTDVTTPDISGRHSKGSFPNKSAAGSQFDRLWAEGESSPCIVEEDIAPDMVSPKEKTSLSLAIPKDVPSLALEDDDDTASIDTAEEIRPSTLEEKSSPAAPAQKFIISCEIPFAPFVNSDLQVHQIRVRDFQLGTHVVHNAMDMKTDLASPFPRKYRKSIFLEMDSEINPQYSSKPEEPEPAPLSENTDVDVEETLRGLSLAAVSGNTAFYTRTDSMPFPSPSPLESVAEEEVGSRVFGHKRSYDDDTVPSKAFENGFGKSPLFPLHERAGEGLQEEEGEESGFKRGHRRSRAVSLGRPKTMVVMPSAGARTAGSYEEEDAELDGAMAEECGLREERSSSDFFDIGEESGEEA